MHNELFTIGNHTVTGYGLCLALAIIAAYFTTEIGIRYYKLNIDIALPMVASAVIPGFIGAKLLYLIQNLKEIIENPSILGNSIVDGYVIYGGIIVAIPSVYICLKIKKVDILQYMDIGIASIAIAQCIGRIGCFMAGCCYGKYIADSHWYTITYTNSKYAVNNVELFPIQIVMSILDLINFIILCIHNKKSKIKGATLTLYMITYGIGRFIIEFFRGDIDRGTVGILTTSQFISIFVAIIGILLLILLKYKYKQDIKKQLKLKEQANKSYYSNASKKRRKSK